MKCNIRWLDRRNMGDVLDIERQSFPNCWGEEDFMAVLRQRNCLGMVATNPAERIVGFMVYELHKLTLKVLNFAVHPNYRRQTIGRQMVDGLKEKLSIRRRKELVLTVRETNLPAQLFFKSQGFRAEGIVPYAYDDTNESGYWMRYVLPGSDVSERWIPRNRISEYVA